MGDSFSIAGTAGAVSMANASSPAVHSVCLNVSTRRERDERDTNSEWGLGIQQRFRPGN